MITLSLVEMLQQQTAENKTDRFDSFWMSQKLSSKISNCTYCDNNQKQRI